MKRVIPIALLIAAPAQANGWDVAFRLGEVALVAAAVGKTVAERDGEGVGDPRARRRGAGRLKRRLSPYRARQRTQTGRHRPA